MTLTAPPLDENARKEESRLENWWHAVSEANLVKDLSPTPGTSSTPHSFGQVCSDCHELLPAGISQCPQHRQAWVFAIPIFHEPADPLQQACRMLLHQFPRLTRVAHLQPWQLVHHARTIQLWISGFMSLTHKLRARQQPSVPIMSNNHVILLWSMPGKHLEGKDVRHMGYSPTPESTELTWRERTSDSKSARTTTFLVGTECQVCGRLRFQETTIIQQDKQESIQGTRLEPCWCIRSENSITTKMAAASTVSLGDHRVTIIFPITRTRFHKGIPIKPERSARRADYQKMADTYDNKKAAYPPQPTSTNHMPAMRNLGVNCCSLRSSKDASAPSSLSLSPISSHCRRYGTSNTWKAYEAYRTTVARPMTSMVEAWPHSFTGDMPREQRCMLKDMTTGWAYRSRYETRDS